MNRFRFATCSALVVAASVAVFACAKTDEPSSGSASSSPAPPPSTVAVSIKGLDAMANLHPNIPRAPKATKPMAPQILDAAVTIVQPSREPDWDLDTTDPARDYVTRYLHATARYGDKTLCVIASPSTDNGTSEAPPRGGPHPNSARKRVEVKDDPKASCFAGGGASDSVRDVFLVDAMGDRLSLEDPEKGATLRKWPDGSDPEGPAGALSAIDVSKGWKSPLREAIVALQQSPIRAQFYGRGTYPVVTLAGWHSPISEHGDTSGLVALAEKLCGANGNNPIGFVTALNRVDMLRVRCGGGSGAQPSAAWESFK